MTQKNNTTTQPFYPATTGKRMVQGAGIALAVITIFLLQSGTPHPAWPTLWMLKPLIIVPLAGALGGAVYAFISHRGDQGGWKRALAILLGLAGYMVALWLGIVLGLNGTLWD